VPELRYESQDRGNAQDVGGTPESGYIPSTTGSNEESRCVRAPEEKDSLSQAKAYAEALMRQLTQ
jgi:hypothetical protein